MYGKKPLRVQETFAASRFNPGVNTPADLLKPGGYTAAGLRLNLFNLARPFKRSYVRDSHTYPHTHVFVFSPQPAASFRDKTCLVNSILMWIICYTAASSDSPLEGNHTATVTETCSRVAITQRGQSRLVCFRTAPQSCQKKSDHAARCTVTRLPPRRDLTISYENTNSSAEVSIANSDKSRL